MYRGHLLQITREKHPLLARGGGIGGFRDFEVWLKFYVGSCCAVCKIVLYCSAIYWIYINVWVEVADCLCTHNGLYCCLFGRNKHQKQPSSEHINSSLRQYIHYTCSHYSDVIMSMMASHTTGILVVYWNVCSGADKKNTKAPRHLAFVRGIHRWTVSTPHQGPVTRKMFPFDNVIMYTTWWAHSIKRSNRLFSHIMPHLACLRSDDVVSFDCTTKVMTSQLTRQFWRTHVKGDI